MPYCALLEIKAGSSGINKSGIGFELYNVSNDLGDSHPKINWICTAANTAIRALQSCI